MVAFSLMPTLALSMGKSGVRGVSPRMLLREFIRETPQFGRRQHGVVDRDAIHFRAFDLAVIAAGVNGHEGGGDNGV